MVRKGGVATLLIRKTESPGEGVAQHPVGPDLEDSATKVSLLRLEMESPEPWEDTVSFWIKLHLNPSRLWTFLFLSQCVSFNVYQSGLCLGYLQHKEPFAMQGKCLDWIGTLRLLGCVPGATMMASGKEMGQKQLVSQ